MQLELYNKGTIILREGELSNNKMYVIISGRLAVIVKKQFGFN
jgi:CRP-like cAMP-binding protein